jgi:hypothetical protein
MDLGMGMWVLVWLLIACAALAAVLGFWHDRTHRPGRERLLTGAPYDVSRATTMSNYYVSNHGTEW